jgi:hypothetical protein
MPINKTKRNIEFEVEGAEFTLGFRFHHTEEYGPTLSIIDSQGREYMWPAHSVVEAVDFLRDEGVVPMNAVQTPFTQAGQKTVAAPGRAGGLMVPQINRGKLTPNISEPVAQEYAPQTPVVSFHGGVANAAVPMVDPVNEQEAKAMAEQRVKALEKAKQEAAKKPRGIARKHTKKEDTEEQADA